MNLETTNKITLLLLGSVRDNVSIGENLRHVISYFFVIAYRKYEMVCLERSFVRQRTKKISRKWCVFPVHRRNSQIKVRRSPRWKWRACIARVVRQRKLERFGECLCGNFIRSVSRKFSSKKSSWSGIFSIEGISFTKMRHKHRRISSRRLGPQNKFRRPSRWRERPGFLKIMSIDRRGGKILGTNKRFGWKLLPAKHKKPAKNK